MPISGAVAVGDRRKVADDSAVIGLIYPAPLFIILIASVA